MILFSGAACAEVVGLVGQLHALYGQFGNVVQWQAGQLLWLAYGKVFLDVAALHKYR